MNRRDEFAKAALGIAGPLEYHDHIPRRVEFAYKIADAMLAASGERTTELPEVNGDEVLRCRVGEEGHRFSNSIWRVFGSSDLNRFAWKGHQYEKEISDPLLLRCIAYRDHVLKLEKELEELKGGAK